jgi:hypothetical protein
MPNIAARLRRREQLGLTAARRNQWIWLISVSMAPTARAGKASSASAHTIISSAVRAACAVSRVERLRIRPTEQKDHEPGGGTRQNRLTGRPRTPQPRKTSPTTQSENRQATTPDPRKIRVREHSCVANHWTARDGNSDSLEIAGAAPLFGRPGPNSATSRITPTWRAANSTCSATESDMSPPRSPATRTGDCDRLDPRLRHVR